MTKAAKKLDGEVLKCDMKPAWYLKGPNGQERTYWAGTRYLLDVDAKVEFLPSAEACLIAMESLSKQPGWKVVMRPEAVEA